MIMDVGELDLPNVGELPSVCSMDSFFDEIFNDTHGCTHTHTCNPPGPDYSHTHTCLHVHTKVLPVSSEDKVGSDDTAESTEKESKKRSLGNREAVRKYREKKKARTASLEDEVARLTAINQRLMKRLRGQAALEAEIGRLKCLLVDIRGRIEGEIGFFPYQKTAKAPIYPSAHAINPCNVQGGNQVYCLRPGVEAKIGEFATLGDHGFNGCEFENLECTENSNSELNELPGCEHGNAMSGVKFFGAKKRKGGACAATAG